MAVGGAAYLGWPRRSRKPKCWAFSEMGMEAIYEFWRYKEHAVTVAVDRNGESCYHGPGDLAEKELPTAWQ